MTAPQQKVDLVVAAMTAHQNGDLKTAEKLYHKILEINPAVLAALNGMGVLRSAEKRYAEAADYFRRAAELNQDVPEFHMNLGSAYYEDGKLEDAVAAFHVAVKLDPRNAKAHYLIAKIYEKLEKQSESAFHYRKVLEIEPNNLEAMVNGAEQIRGEGAWEEAERLLTRADQIAPNHYGIYNNFGTLRQVQNRIPEAVDYYRRCVGLNPKFMKGYNNLGVALQDMGDFEGAMQAYAAALQQDPGFTLTEYNRALCLLSYGRLAEGWKAWDIRCDFKDNRHFPQKLWDGSDLQGKSVLLWGDQAIGEDILQASLFDDLLARGARLIVEVPPRLIPLFQRRWPQVTFVKKPPLRGKEHIQHELTDKRLLDPSIDFQCKPIAASRFLRNSFSDFPTQRRSYLQADSALTTKLKHRYQALGAKQVVGIAWRSSAKFGRYKSSQLDDWLPILSQPDTVFIDLQYGDNSAELAEFHARYPQVRIYHDLEVNQMMDLDAFAAQVSACDRVISISNTTVHFAGALGIECHLMLPTGLGALWYWFRDRADSPWYPSITIHRQSMAGEWRDVIRSVAQSSS